MMNIEYCKNPTLYNINIIQQDTLIIHTFSYFQWQYIFMNNVHCTCFFLFK